MTPHFRILPIRLQIPQQPLKRRGVVILPAIENRRCGRVRRIIMSLGRSRDMANGLTDVELDRLNEFLTDCKGAMNIEEVDGFFAALIAGPEVVPPSEYLPEVFGAEMSNVFAG